MLPDEIETMKRLTGLATLLFAGVLGATTLTAQEAETTKLSELERISDAVGLQELIVEKIRENFMSNPEVTESGLTEENLLNMREILINRFDMQDFLSEAILPVLDPHFTTAELGSVADFLESTLGQTFMQAQKDGEEFDFMAAMQSEEFSREDVMKAMTTQGIDAIGGTPKEFATFIRADIDKWTALSAASAEKK